MSYSTLEQGEFYLAHYSAASWDATRAKRAESYAKIKIDTFLLDWYRESWNATPPEQVAEIHRQIASALYILWDALEANPLGETPAAVRDLQSMAETSMDRIVSQGGPVVDGERLPKVGSSGVVSGMMIRGGR